ncbi:hypothetical protein NIES2101_39865 [Calothrix sp. HK-06]|nr:hypothetical protein NIES2101_39865 [Calothrix sp. HK-06]
MFKSVQAIFYFVNDVVAAAQWYSQLLDLPVKYFYVENEVRGAAIDINGIKMFFHLTDEMQAFWKCRSSSKRSALRNLSKL